VRKENMKTKILLLAMLISMCSGGSDVAEDKNIVSLSTTHTEHIEINMARSNIFVFIFSFLTTRKSKILHSFSRGLLF
jgi:hypothetical protein